MESVKVSKDQLRETLIKNRETHEADFELAWTAFKEKVIHNFEERLRVVKNLKKNQEINLHVNLQVPENHTDDYDRAIEMLEWEVDDEVELTQYEFQTLVQDNWDWKSRFQSANQFYTGSISPSSVSSVTPKNSKKRR